jgi:hypothetical protein
MYDNKIAKRKELGLPTQVITHRKAKEYCPSCKRILAFSAFSTIRTRFGVAARCKECNSDYTAKYYDLDKARKRYQREKATMRNTTLIRKYGITLSQYNEMLASQNGVCKICGEIDKTKSLAVDHNHITGKVRGLLCSKCNTSIGMLHDNTEVAKNLIQYLEVM